MFEDIFYKVKRSLTKHSPELLIVAGTFGYLTSVVLAVKAHEEAEKALEKERPNFGTIFYKRDLLWKEAKVVAPYYAPTAGIFILSTAAVVAANTVSSNRQAALAGAYAVTDKALRVYKEQIRTQLTPSQADAVRTGAIGERMKDAQEPVTILETGDTNLYFDAFSARYFTFGSIEDVRAIVNTLNERLFTEMTISVNDFYYELGLEMISQGDKLGWDLANGRIVIDYGSKLTPKGRSAIVLDYSVQPTFI